MIRSKGYARSLEGGASSPDKDLSGVGKIICIASGKGGVGKSTVAVGLSLALSRLGFRVGLLDADIYGPSIPSLFGLDDFLPVAKGDGKISPAVVDNIKVMSIGFFVAPSDALVWRGPMTVNALRQLVRQTDWGELDFLLVDLPPGTGDIQLSLPGEVSVSGALVVSAPGALSLADVRRGVAMFRSEGVNIPILGLVENMSWFSPAELPDNQYFIFGRGQTEEFARQSDIDFFGQIPLILSTGRSGVSLVDLSTSLAPYFHTLAKKVVDKV